MLRMRSWSIGRLTALGRRLRWGEGGQSLVEFALVVPILLMVLMAIMDFGRVMNAWILVSHGAREGARYASVRASASEIESSVRNALSTLDGSRLTVTVTNAQGSSGDPVTVAVNYAIDILTPLIAPFFLQNPMPLAAQVTMRLE